MNLFNGLAFIELEYPTELLILIQVSLIDSYNPFLLYTIEYGRDIIDTISESKEFEQFDLTDLKNLFKNGYDFEFKKIEERISRAFIKI